MPQRKHTSPSLFRRIVLPFMGMVVLLAVGFYLSSVYGGVMTALDENSESVLQERIQSKKTDLNSKFLTEWTDMSVPLRAVGEAYSDLPAHSAQEFSQDADMQRSLLSAVAPQLITSLRSNQVTGVFLVLNNSATYQGPVDGKTQRNFGLCVRDYDPTGSYSANEDLLVPRCPSAMVSGLGCSVDSTWEATYIFGDKDDGAYYYEPLNQAYLNPDVGVENLAYFCAPHNFGENDRKVVSYSIPLVDETGYPYAVLGVELTTEYLSALIPSSSLYSSEDAAYALVQYEEGSDAYSLVATNGMLFQQAFGTSQTLRASSIPGKEGLVKAEDTLNGLSLIGGVSDLIIYNHNTPFEHNKLALMGIVKEESLYEVSSLVRNRLLIISLAVLIIGAAGSFLVSRRITRPVTALSDKVRQMDDETVPDLDRLNIAEIDDLVESIEDLSTKVDRSRVRSEFFSRMSHDMRTPMNAIIGFSSPEIIDHATPSQLSEYLGKIHVSGSYLLGLINEVLDMSKIEAKRMELRLRPVEAHCLWSDPVSMIAEVAKEKNVSFEPDIVADGIWVLADRQRVNQIMMNLLSNAVKFTPAGGCVSYAVENLGAYHNRCGFRITVSDTGQGMSPEFVKKMYEPFMQERPSAGGTGLGLAITKQIVELMDGTITCTSKQDEGTTFTVELSFAQADASEVERIQDENGGEDSAAAAGSDSVGSKLAGKRVLLCEDHPINAQIASMLLTRKGMTVDHAEDGSKGLNRFLVSKPGTYDLVLMDIRMPVMDGLETARAIRASDRADAATVPIVAMTANAFAEDVDKSREAGMQAHISKPIDPTILYRTIEHVLAAAAK